MKRNVRIFAVAALAAFASAATAFAAVTDVLTRETTGVTTTTYSDWTYTSTESGAVYVGKTAGGNSSIQFKSKDSVSGIVTTTSGGKVKKISVVWEDNTASGRTLEVYGKSSAYSAATDLYGNGEKGTKIGTIVCGTSTELEISGDYEYIGLRSNSGAMYITSISIEWATAGDPVVVTVAAPEITADPTSFEESTTVTIKAEEGAAIYYTTDGNEPTAESTAYTAAFDVTETATVKAIAVKDGKTSSVASLALTKIEVTSMTLADVAAWIAEKDITKGNETLGYVKVTFNNAKVLWVDEANHYAYVREGDAAAAINLYYFTKNDKAVTAEDAELIDIQDNYVISGEYKCQLKAYYGVAQISSTKKDDFASDPTVLTISSNSEAAEPVAATLAEIEACKYICNLVELTNVTFTKDDKEYFWVNSGDNDVEVKVTNDLIPEEYVNKLYNVKAVVSSTYKNEGVLALLSCEYVGEVSPEDPGTVTAVAGVAAELDENAPIYNLQGQRVDKDAKGILIQNGKKFVVK